MSGINLYENTAHLYDLDPSLKQLSLIDVPFYLEYAKKLKGPILELSCGTGRVSIPLAKEGHEVVALDLSENMLEHIKAKIVCLPPETKENITVVNGNMKEFSFDKRFSLVIIPLRGIQCLVSESDQRQCLKCIYEHLSDGGKLIIDVFKPGPEFEIKSNPIQKKHWETVDPRTGLNVAKHSCAKIDIKNKLIHLDTTYLLSGNELSCASHDDKKFEIRDSATLKVHFYDELKKLIISEGFRIEEEFGNYDKCSVSKGSEIIFVCGKDLSCKNGMRANGGFVERLMRCIGRISHIRFK